jgi:hypothetical protein
MTSHDMKILLEKLFLQIVSNEFIFIEKTMKNFLKFFKIIVKLPILKNKLKFLLKNLCQMD